MLDASHFAPWLLTHADDLEVSLSEQEWPLFLDAELVAAEYTSGYIDDDTCRHRLLEVLSPLDLAPAPLGAHRAVLTTRGNVTVVFLGKSNFTMHPLMVPSPLQTGTAHAREARLRMQPC